MNLKTVALIPIKMNSKRISEKNIKPFFDGTPLMAFIQKVCLKSTRISETYVYCSDKKIQKYLLPGINYLERPSYLDGDAINANDIIKEFIKEVDADIYINVHTTAPFAEVDTIDTCIEKIASGEYDSAFCVERLRTFLWMKGVPLNFDLDRFPRTQDLPPVYAETSIAYAFRKETFLKYQRRVGVTPYIHEVGKIEAVDIDYPEDFDIANAIYKDVIQR